MASMAGFCDARNSFAGGFFPIPLRDAQRQGQKDGWWWLSVSQYARDRHCTRQEFPVAGEYRSGTLPSAMVLSPLPD